jgi:hypothetical protein
MSNQPNCPRLITRQEAAFLRIVFAVVTVCVLQALVPWFTPAIWVSLMAGAALIGLGHQHYKTRHSASVPSVKDALRDIRNREGALYLAWAIFGALALLFYCLRSAPKTLPVQAIFNIVETYGLLALILLPVFAEAALHMKRPGFNLPVTIVHRVVKGMLTYEVALWWLGAEGDAAYRWWLTHQNQALYIGVAGAFLALTLIVNEGGRFNFKTDREIEQLAQAGTWRRESSNQKETR